MKGKLSLKTDCATLIVGRKFTVFALFFCITGLEALYLEGLILGLVHVRNFTVAFFAALIAIPCTLLK